MAPSDNEASGGERRLSTRSARSSIRAKEHNAENSEESYDLAEFSVADGFRPTGSTTTATTITTTSPQNSLQPPSESTRARSPALSHNSASSSRPQGSHNQEQLAAPIANYTNTPLRSRPSSISKAHRPHESLALRNDGSFHTESNRPQLPTLTTGTSFFGAESGSEGHSGMSHPYHAYQQTTMDDTGPSIADSPHEGQQGPAHPYSLYPQATAPLDEDHAHHIQVGFNGMGGAYQRQLGPDGEEAGDLVGPMGHMEALPPYTRYPEQSYQGSSQAEPATSTIPTRSSADGTHVSEASRIAGAGGIGMATRNPEYSSTDENLPVSQPGRSGDSSEVSQSDINTAAKDFADKLPTGKWQRRARKKCLGVIPYWAICLLVVGLIIVGIVMGTVLGVLLSDNNKPKVDGDESSATYGPQSTNDVEPLDELPKNLAPLVVGIFDLPPLNVAQAPNTCFNDTTQSQAWSCEMPLRYYSMEIDKLANASAVENYVIQLEAINGSDSYYVWGTQPPSITDPVALTLVNDTFQPARGPAWWRQITYDKSVLVSDANFNNQRRKRDWTYTGTGSDTFNPSRFMATNSGPEDGEEAWICTWPNVTMEIFIYPSQNASTHTPTTTTSSAYGAAATPASSESSKKKYTEDDSSPSYPQVVKFLERRLYEDNDDTAATCRKVKIRNHARDSDPVLDSNGDPIVVDVAEKRSTYEEVVEAKQRSRHPDRRSQDGLDKRETLELTDCGCLWWST